MLILVFIVLTNESLHKSRSFLLRLYFFAEKWQRRSGLSPEGSPTARKYSRHHRPRKPRTWLTPYFHRAHRPKQSSTVFASLTFRPCQIRNSRLIQKCRFTVLFLSLKIDRKSLIDKGFFAFVVHFGICGAYILRLGCPKMQKSTTPRQGVVPSYR